MTGLFFLHLSPGVGERAHWLRMGKTVSEDLSSISSAHIGQLQESGSPGLPWHCTPVCIIKNKANLKRLTNAITDVYWAPAIFCFAGTGDIAVSATQQPRPLISWKLFLSDPLCSLIWPGTESELRLRSSNGKKIDCILIYSWYKKITKYATSPHI